MSWEDKSVTLGNVDKQEFETQLAHVTVSENGIRIAFEQVDDWHRIQREVGDEMILREVTWDQVEGLEVSEDHLYYPHIDVQIEPEDETDVLHERRIYFVEDEEETMQRVRNAIRKYWNAYRQRGAGQAGTYAYQDRDEDVASDDEAVALEEAIEADGPADAEGQDERPGTADKGGETGGGGDAPDTTPATEAVDEAADADTTPTEDVDEPAGDGASSAKDKMKRIAGRGDGEDEPADKREETEGKDGDGDPGEDADGGEPEEDEEDEGGYVDDIVDGFMEE